MATTLKLPTMIELAKQVKEGQSAADLEAQLTQGLDLVQGALVNLQALRDQWAQAGIGTAEDLAGADAIRTKALTRLSEMAK